MKRQRRGGALRAILFCLQLWVGGLAGAVTLDGWTLQEDRTIAGNLELGGGTLDLNGHMLDIAGSLIQSGGVVRINGGTLKVQGSYRIQAPCTTTLSGYCISSGSLAMTDNRDKVTVQEDFVVESSSRSTELTAGMLEIKGNFRQFAPDPNDSRLNFVASGTHLTVLSGNLAQSVFFTSYGASEAHFAGLALSNTSVEGVNFLSPVVATVSFAANSTKFVLANPAQSSLPGYSSTAVGPVLTIAGPVTVASGGRISLSAATTSTGGTASAVTPAWSVSPTSTASISTDGILMAGNVSTDTRVTLNASYMLNGVTLTASRIITITVATPDTSPPVSLNLIGPAVMQGGGRLDLMANALYEDGSTRTITPTWTSSNPAAAVVGNTGVIYAGYVNNDTPVTVTARYSENGVAVAATLQVKILASRAVPASLTITGPENLQANGRAQLMASAAYADDSRRPVMPRTWSISDPALGAVDGRGFLKVGGVTSDTPLTVTATHTEGGTTVTASHTLTIKAAGADLGRLTIIGARGILAAGASMQLLAEGRYADGSRRTIAAQWRVSDSGVASITADGVLTVGSVTRDTPLLIEASYSEGSTTTRATFHTLIQATLTQAPLQAEVEATGELDSYSLSLWFNTNEQATTTRNAHATRTARSTTYNLYVAALLPVGPLATSPTYFLLNRSNTWEALAWPLAEYLSGVEEDTWELVELLESTDATLISGTQVFIGYGTSGDEMIAANRYQMVYQVP